MRTERDTAKMHFVALWRYRLAFVSLLFVGIRLVLRTALGMSRSITRAGARSLTSSLARTSRSNPVSAIHFATPARKSRLSVRRIASRGHPSQRDAERGLGQSSPVEKTPKTGSTFQLHKDVLGIGPCLNTVVGAGELRESMVVCRQHDRQARGIEVGGGRDHRGELASERRTRLGISIWRV